MLIGIQGFAGAGKSTVAKMLCDKFMFTEETFAGPLKDAVAAIFGWKRELVEGATAESRAFREKRDEYWSAVLNRPITPRLILQEFGTEVVRNNVHSDIWVKSLEYRLNQSKNYVITDVRFVNEMQLIKKMGGFLVIVDNGKVPDWYGPLDDYIALMAKPYSPDEIQRKFPQAHQSEWNRFLSDTQNDFILHNDGSLDDLEANVLTMFKLFHGPHDKTATRSDIDYRLNAFDMI